jgi:hypothetical protein
VTKNKALLNLTNFERRSYKQRAKSLRLHGLKYGVKILVGLKPTTN